MTEEQVFAEQQAEAVRSKPPWLHRHQLAGHLNLALDGLGVNLRPFRPPLGLPAQRGEGQAGALPLLPLRLCAAEAGHQGGRQG